MVANRWRTAIVDNVRYFSSKPASQPYRVAIVGSGPAAFYTAHHLLNRGNSGSQMKIKIDFFERLPAPYGLSRYGVAPDHPEVKNCEEYLNNIMDESSSHETGQVRFFGNVEIGRDISLKTLHKGYHSVVLAYGCTTADNSLNIPGESLPGVYSARQFVNWYNGFPDNYTQNFAAPPLHKARNVTIIGNGNVAMDVARVLLAGSSHWKPTDMVQNAVEVLEKSLVEHVNIVARRGILESAFSNKEIRELFEVSKKSGVRFLPLDNDMLTSFDTKKLGRVDKRRLDILRKFTKEENGQNGTNNAESAQKSWALKYLMSPVEIVASKDDPGLLSAVKFARNTLKMDPVTQKATVSRSDEPPITVDTDLLLLSIGYKGSQLRGMEEMGITFQNNRIVNDRGRIVSRTSGDSHVKNGWYTSGWIKNGPQGVIATTMMDSFDTAESILEDLAIGIFCTKSPESIEQEISRLDSVSWKQWLQLDRREVDEGRKTGKTRVKFSNTQRMLEIAHESE